MKKRYPTTTAVLSVLVFASLAWPSPANGQSKPCGIERWPVKTLADSDGATVATRTAQTATIEQLTSSTAPTRAQLQKAVSTRFAPQEESVYEVKALLIGYKLESDKDFHIVLADPADETVTMIVEIPSGMCASGNAGQVFAALQDQFVEDFGKPTPTFKRLKTPTAVDVRGVGFFDFLHGQTGVAKNGFELHPVLSIKQIQ